MVSKDRIREIVYLRFGAKFPDLDKRVIRGVSGMVAEDLIEEIENDRLRSGVRERDDGIDSIELLSPEKRDVLVQQAMDKALMEGNLDALAKFKEFFGIGKKGSDNRVDVVSFNDVWPDEAEFLDVCAEGLRRRINESQIELRGNDRCGDVR